MAYLKKNKRAINAESDSAIGLFKKLGGDDSVPQKIQFTGGQLVPIQTNAYSLTHNAAVTIHQYDVKITPEILNERLIRTYVYKAICGPDAGPMGANERWGKVIFDGQHVIFSPLDDLACNKDIPPRDDKPDEKAINVTVTHVGEVSTTNSESLLQIYNIAFQSVYRSLHLEPFARKWLDSTQSYQAGDFQITQGFIPSIQMLSSGLSYIVNVATKIDRNGNLYQFLRGFGNDSNFRSSAEEALRGLTVVAVHNPKKPQQLQRLQICWDKTPDNTHFERRDRNGNTTSMTVRQYFSQVYHHECPPDDILILVERKMKGESFKNYFPASVCKISGITDSDRRKGRLMKEIASHTRMPISKRKERFDTFIQQINSDKDASQFLERWGFQLGASKEVNGYLIPAPKLVFGRDRRETPSQSDLTYKNVMKNIQLLSVPTLQTKPLFVGLSSSKREMDELLRLVQRLSPNLGFPIKDVIRRDISNSHPNDYAQAIIDCIKGGEVPSFVVCLLPSSDRKRYDGIKRLLSVQLGIPSQCVREEGLQNDRGVQSIVTNIIAQIATKAGGAICQIDPESLKLTHTMVVGLSLTPSRGGTPIAAGVASYDRNFTHFFSSTCTIDSTERTVPESFLSEFIEAALEKWKETNEEYPKRVVVYRDGVSYGQMPAVREKESNKIRDFLAQVDPEIALTFIICQKQGSIKVMAKDQSGNVNCKAGTVVTEGVAVSDVAEFYLISHGVRPDATASPTRYTIIQSTPGVWNDDNLITLTHYLTMTYPNWQGPIRIPCCLMLASKLAEMTKLHLGDAPKDRLKYVLHYL